MLVKDPLCHMICLYFELEHCNVNHELRKKKKHSVENNFIKTISKLLLKILIKHL